MKEMSPLLRIMMAIGWAGLSLIFFRIAPAPFNLLVPGFFVPAALALVLIGPRNLLLNLVGFCGAAFTYYVIAPLLGGAS